MKPVLVTSYVNPDLDGVASMVTYAEYLQATGTNAVAGVIGEPQVEAGYALNRFGVTPPDTLANADGFDEVILVDVSDPNDLEGTVAAGKVIEIIDHRDFHDADAFPNAKTHIEPVGAAATLIAEKFMHSATPISEASAALLYGAILSNTLNFQGSMTTARDREAAAWLNATAKLPEGYWREQSMAKSDVSGDKLAARIEDDFSWFVFDGRKVGIAEIELIGAGKLLEERGAEVVQVLESIKKRLNLDDIFQNTIELDGAASYLVAADATTQELLTGVFGVPFVNSVAKLPNPLMRKQIVPLLKKALE